MGKSLRDQVIQRAGGRCEYCRIPEEYDEAVFCLDHIRAKKHDGATRSSNLALTCYWCNTYKGDNLSGVDPISDEITRLFHPRRDDWHAHFAWNGPILVGTTDIARATIKVLRMNAPVRVALRRVLMDEGVVF
jgi:hypothetical protein